MKIPYKIIATSCNQTTSTNETLTQPTFKIKTMKSLLCFVCSRCGDCKCDYAVYGQMP